MFGNEWNIVPYQGQKFGMDARDVGELAKLIDQYGDAARDVINEELHGDGASAIKKNISPLIPVSDRNKQHAASAMPGAFKQSNGNLFVEIIAGGKYHYLYFPDDGSNTIHHAGNQHFMQKGAEESTDEIVERITEKLVEKIGG